MSILTGPAIRDQVQRGTIEIDPYVPEHVNPASVDLTLGTTYARYKKFRPPPYAPEEGYNFLDAREEQEVERFEMGGTESSLHLAPGFLYLMHTVERVYTDVFVPVLDGKSSIGRLGVSVHVTAGYGDPGFNGQYTLEVTCVHPVVLYAGMRIAQMRFHTVMGDIELYGGNYVEETARGPVASRSWRQFK